MMISFIGLIFTGFPIAWVLGGLAAIFTAFAIIFEVDFDIVTNVDWYYTSMSVDRVWDVMENWVMVALPMFIFMGILLDRSGLAKDLLTGFSRLLGGVKGGLAITVTLIGVLLAASTGIIGASVVLLGLLGLPVMLENNYDKQLAAGTVCAVGTLGILIPPSIMLVVMADRMAMSVGDLFLGALIPGALLGGLYIVYLLLVGLLKPNLVPAAKTQPIDLAAVWILFKAIVPAAFLITLTMCVINLASGVTTSVPSRAMLSSSSVSISCSSSSCIPSTIVLSSRTVPSSSSIPSLKVPSCSCSTLITFSKVVSRICVSESHA